MKFSKVFITSVITLCFLCSVAVSGETIVLKLKHNGGKGKQVNTEKRFEGVIFIPEEVKITKGFGPFGGVRAEIVVDDDVFCYYDGRKITGKKKLKLKECTGGLQSGDRVEVKQKIAFKVDRARYYFTKTYFMAQIKVAHDEPEDGLIFEGINPTAGQILKFNGEFWIPSDNNGSGVVDGNDINDLLLWSGDSWMATSIADVPELVGPIGPQGLQGPAGVDGAVGAIGPQGLQGLQGPAGVDGAVGAIGPQGLQGLQGPAGVDGAVGAIG
ncbi:MAG: collagen-like protein, partial [Bacteriovoracaceae bacterium]|nr:collagen-like protein [Bacteriovoracaceae bacterium]